jgi:hypothetical protein
LKEPTRSKFMLGLSSKLTSCPLDCTPTPSSTILAGPNASRSSALPLTQLERIDSVLDTLINPSNPNQSEPPWTAGLRPSGWPTEQTQPPWMAGLRPSGWPTEQTQGWMETRGLHSFNKRNSQDTQHQMTQQNPKLP